VVDSTPYYDVYPSTKLTDGDKGGNSYYESDGFGENGEGAYFVIDLLQVTSISQVLLFLNPDLSWEARTQNLTIYGSNLNIGYNPTNKATIEASYFELVANNDALFDPVLGNFVQYEVSAQVRYVKVVIYSNSIPAGYGAQISEISIY
jgi:hypothetical protein